MKNLQDTIVGLLGSFIFMFVFDRMPLLAISMIGFHIGVTTMRASRPTHPQAKRD